MGLSVCGASLVLLNVTSMLPRKAKVTQRGRTPPNNPKWLDSVPQVTAACVRSGNQRAPPDVNSGQPVRLILRIAIMVEMKMGSYTTKFAVQYAACVL